MKRAEIYPIAAWFGGVGNGAVRRDRIRDDHAQRPGNCAWSGSSIPSSLPSLHSGLRDMAYKLARLDALADQPTTSLMVSTTTTAQSASISATTIADPTW